MSVGCRTCGRLNPGGVQQCQYCGALLPAPSYQDPFVEQQPQQQPYNASHTLQQSNFPATQPASYPPPSPFYPAQPMPTIPQKDPSTGLVIELVAGLFGFLGVGYLWAGEVGLGLALMFGYWFMLGMGVFFLIITLGIFACLAPAVWLIVPLVSGLILQSRLKTRQALAARPYNTMPY